MKYYNSYFDRQELSSAAHETLLHLEVRKKASSPVWMRIGALAACTALIVAAGVWKLSPAPAPAPAQSGSQITLDNVPTAEDQPLQTDVSQPGDWETSFVVSNSGMKGKLAFPMIPGIEYPDQTESPDMALSRAYMPGAFTVDLAKEDIQTIFWGPEGKPQADHPKTEQGDLPWMLFWDGYTIHANALYDGQGQLAELTIFGEKGRASFELELCPGDLPFTCSVDLSREDQLSEFNGVEVAGWSQVYDRDGDGQDDYICGSEFMTKNDIGVRFVNRNSLMRVEYEQDGSMDLGGAQAFNALFVRQALTDGGGLYLDHLMINEAIPAWREETFDTLAQARQEADFAPYLPTAEPSGYGEFYGRLSYQEGAQNMLFVRWNQGYDNVEVAVYRGENHSYNLADPARPETYDLRLYPIPWCDSVPQEYWDTVNAPAFRAEDMSLELVEARGREHDTGGMTYSFEVLHPDGTVVSYRCDALSARQVWELVEETL